MVARPKKHTPRKLANENNLIFACDETHHSTWQGDHFLLRVTNHPCDLGISECMRFLVAFLQRICANACCRAAVSLWSILQIQPSRDQLGEVDKTFASSQINSGHLRFQHHAR
jgi:hypothetical protein